LHAVRNSGVTKVGVTGAVTDGVTLFFPQKSDYLFLFIVIVTTTTLSAFQVIVCPVFFVNSAAKMLGQVIVCPVFFVNSAAKMLGLSFWCHPWMVSPGTLGGPPH